MSLKFCLLCHFSVWARKKNPPQCQKNTRREQSRAQACSGFRAWQRDAITSLSLTKALWSFTTLFSFLSFLVQAAHPEKRKENQSTDHWPPAFASKLWRNQSWNYPWSTSEPLEKEATWIMWLHFLLLPFFQGFIIGKRFYFHHTLIVLWFTEAKW